MFLIVKIVGEGGKGRLDWKEIFCWNIFSQPEMNGGEVAVVLTRIMFLAFSFVSGFRVTEPHYSPHNATFTNQILVRAIIKVITTA